MATAPTGNHILDALPQADVERLARQLTSVVFGVATVLYEPDDVVERVYFPIEGVISLVTPVQEGAAVEVATVGNEGIVGIPYALDGGVAYVRAIAQVSGRSLTMTAAEFRKEVATDRQLADMLLRYTDALFSQISRAAGCNRLHSNEERLARWLLMSHDRVDRDQFPVTQEFLSQMLGSRRATVTVSAGILQAAGLIRYRRGLLTIVDREGLENAACECYGVISEALKRVTAGPAQRSNR